MSKWYTVYCEACGAEIIAHEDWDNPPTLCKECKARRDAQWYEVRCKDCGTGIMVNVNWDNPPTLCKECKAKRSAQWYEVSCKDCGTTIRVHRDWDNPPTLCKECKAKRNAQWYDVSCKNCGRTFRAHRDWEKPPTLCKKCLTDFAPKDIRCSECGNVFTVSTKLQLKCSENGWNLPTRCIQCKNDDLLIQGAIGALRDRFDFPLEAKIEKRGIIPTDKVAVVRNKKTGEIVARVTMDDLGLLLPNRVAIATDFKSNKRISKTTEANRLRDFQQRAAETYDMDKRKHTHVTTIEETGGVCKKHYARTVSKDTSSLEDTITRILKKGSILFPKYVAETDKEKR